MPTKTVASRRGAGPVVEVADHSDRDALQRAVDSAPDGATVRLGEGDYDLWRLRPRTRIVGSLEGREEMWWPRVTVHLDVGPAQSLELEAVRLHGGLRVLGTASLSRVEGGQQWETERVDGLPEDAVASVDVEGGTLSLASSQVRHLAAGAGARVRVRGSKALSIVADRGAQVRWAGGEASFARASEWAALIADHAAVAVALADDGGRVELSLARPGAGAVLLQAASGGTVRLEGGRFGASVRAIAVGDGSVVRIARLSVPGPRATEHPPGLLAQACEGGRVELDAVRYYAGVGVSEGGSLSLAGVQRGRARLWRPGDGEFLVWAQPDDDQSAVLSLDGLYHDDLDGPPEPPADGAEVVDLATGSPLGTWAEWRDADLYECGWL